MYPTLSFARFTTAPRIDVEDMLVAHALENSMGQPTMSPEDTKLAIVSLMVVCKHQQSIIDELTDAINEMREPKKKFWHRPKK